MAVATKTWSKAEIERLLAVENFKYQDIALPHGLSTGGEDRSATARAIFPDDLSGKSVLDLGCSFGYFCFEAARRGARRVLGVDVDPDTIRKARLLADCLDAKVEFRLLNVEHERLVEDFDYILCLNLLHHLRNPLALLDELIAHAQERLVLEVAGLGFHDRRKLAVSALGHFFLARAPVIFVGRNGTSGRFSGQKFFITPTALSHLLVYQRNSFAQLRQLPSEHKGRYIVIAEKRRIDDLVVVAGPTTSGKSWLIERLRAGQEPGLCGRLGMGDGRSWPAMNAFDLLEPQAPHLARLLFHYDTLRPLMRSAHVHARDEALDILTGARRARVLTIWHPPDLLLEQFEQAEIRPKTKGGVFKGNKRKTRIHAMYRDPQQIVAHYREWFEFCRARHLEVLVVLPRDGMRCLSVDEWERTQVGRPLAGRGSS